VISASASVSAFEAAAKAFRDGAARDADQLRRHRGLVRGRLRRLMNRFLKFDAHARLKATRQPSAMRRDGRARTNEIDCRALRRRGRSRFPR
jgi:uncharacterized ferritin-like protein (DUF455 family)